MYVSTHGKGDNTKIYILRSFRKEKGSTSSKIHLKLGKIIDLLPEFDNDIDKIME